MATNAFGGISPKIINLLLEKQAAIQQQIDLLEEVDEATATTLSGVTSSSVQFDVSENVSAQIGSAGNYITANTSFYPRSVKVFYNGIKQVEEEHYWITATNKLKLFFTPLSGGFLEIVYTPLSMGGLTSTAIKMMPPQ